MALTPVFVDLETYYSPTYSLTKLSPIEYCADPQFEIISCATKIGYKDETIVTFGQEQTQRLFNSIDWSDKLVIGHNLSEFDVIPLVRTFGLSPARWGCTQAMARPHHAKTCGLSLKALASHYELPAKGSLDAVNTKGKHLDEFTPEERQLMAVYNKLDTDICALLYQKLSKITSNYEMMLIDLTIRMLVNPQFVADIDILGDALSQERLRKEELLRKLATVTNVSDMEQVRASCASTTKFKALIEQLGAAVPMKISPTTGKEIPALAKTDKGMLSLLEHADPLVRTAAEARIGVRSTILETRLVRMAKAAKAFDGLMPIPLRYYGADTGRWSGTMSLNAQNLPRVNNKTPQISDALRKSLRAPEGYKVVVADLSGIELRVNHFLWRVPSSIELYRQDPQADLYKTFAAKLFNIDTSEVNKGQRQLAKLCLAEGTKVLCKNEHGSIWKNIEHINNQDQLWDGEQWVWAQGVVSNGWKKTQQLYGLWLTADHPVLCGTTWKEAQCVSADDFALALERAADRLPLLDMLSALGGASLHLSLPAIAGFLSTRLKLVTSRRSKPHGVTGAPSSRPAKNDIGSTTKLCQKSNTGLGFSTGCTPPLTDAITKKMQGTSTTAAEESACVTCGGVIKQSFFRTFALSTGGIYPLLRLIGWMSTGTTNPVTSDSFLKRKTHETSEKWRIWSAVSGFLNLNVKPLSSGWPNSNRNCAVYDVINSGINHRFTVLTSKGPVIVHNCQLGLGYGVGWRKFKEVARMMGGVTISDRESEDITRRWREAYPEIVEGWARCEDALGVIYDGESYIRAVDDGGLAIATAHGIKTPRGAIRYPLLRREGRQWVYGEGRNKSKTYGACVCENIVQHLSRYVLSDAILRIASTELGKTYPLAHQVHDEVIYIVRDNHAEEMLDLIQHILRTPPTWFPELVTWSEGDIGQTYGDAK